MVTNKCATKVHKKLRKGDFNLRIGRVKIEALFAITDWCLKNSFPDDYDSRCLYNACAIHTILMSEGIKANIVGGDVGIFTLSADGRNALLEGFSGGDTTQPSHYWIDVDGIILDPGATYLPKRSRINALPMPMVAWDKNNALPNYLQYKEKIQFASDVEYVFPDDIANRVSAFVERCQKRYASKAANKKLPTWILSSPKGLNNKAQSGDNWSKGAIRFQSMPSTPTIPV